MSSETTTSADPEDSAKPDSPTDIKKPNWGFVLKSAVREFGDDECTDVAAGLTYRTVFSIFPGLIALVSILSLFGQSGDTVEQVMAEGEQLVPADTWSSVQPAIEGLLTAPAPGLGLVIGLVTALWTASGYVKAFGRAMNKVYEVPEGRGAVKLNLGMYLLTGGILVLLALGMMIFVLSGPVAEQVGSWIGLGAVAVSVWNIAKWFLLALVVVLIIALLYHATPNVKQPKFRWISIGALLAIAVSLLATLGFFFYVTNFGNYNATYGALAGVIIFLLWVYIINAILLFGAEVDAELERGRQLQAGMHAEEELLLPMRDTAAAEKKAQTEAQAVEEARAIRLSAGDTGDIDEAEDLSSTSGREAGQAHADRGAAPIHSGRGSTASVGHPGAYQQGEAVADPSRTDDTR